MDLEELKVIWDAEYQHPRFTLNESDLHAIVQRRMAESSRCAACRYRIEISLSLIVAAATLSVAGLLASGPADGLARLRWPKIAPSSWDIIGLLVAGGIWLYFAGYLTQARRRLQRSGETFESSLRGDINRALARVEFQIQIAQQIVWRGFIPVYFAALVGVLVLFRLSTSPAQSHTLYANGLIGVSVMVAAFFMDVSCRQKAIRERYEPHRHELESLRSKLADPQR